MTWSFPHAIRRYAPPTYGCCGGAPTIEALQARAGCIGVALRLRCSAWPVQTAGGRWHLRRWPAGHDGHVPGHCSKRYKHSARSCIEGALTRAAACAAATGVGSHHALGC
jgi:hypothetical protein